MLRRADDEGPLGGDLVAMGHPGDDDDDEGGHRDDQRDVLQPHRIGAGEVGQPLAGVGADVGVEPVQAGEGHEPGDPEGGEGQRLSPQRRWPGARSGCGRGSAGPARSCRPAARPGGLTIDEPAERHAGDHRRPAAVEHRCGDEHRRAGQHRPGEVGVAEVAQDDAAERRDGGEEDGGRDAGEPAGDDVDAAAEQQEEQEPVDREPGPRAEQLGEGADREDVAQPRPVVGVHRRPVGDLVAEQAEGGVEGRVGGVEPGPALRRRQQSREEGDREDEQRLAGSVPGHGHAVTLSRAREPAGRAQVVTG